MDKHLDPNKSPDLLATSSSQVHGVKKINNLPVVIFLGVVMMMLIAIIFTIFSNDSSGGNNTSKDDAASGEVVDPNKLINSLIMDANGEPKKKKKYKDNISKKENETRQLRMVNEALKRNSSSYPIEDNTPMDTQSHTKIGLSEREKKLLEEERRLRKMKAAMLNDAILSETSIVKMGVDSSKRHSGEDGTDPDSPIGASMGILKEYLKASMNKPKEEIDIRNRNEKFIDTSKKSYSYTLHKKTKLVSKYELKTGAIIPGILLTGLNSELPGEILGQVSENVYDTATGYYMLIPQGTKIIGRYSSGVAYGQTRLLVVWNRLIFPDGQTYNLDAMLGTDKQGYSGFSDDVDNHYIKIFGSAFLLSMIGGDFMIVDGMLTFASGKAKSASNGVEKEESLIEKTGAKMIEKNMNIAPTITVRPGYKFNIFVNKDMILEPLEY